MGLEVADLEEEEAYVTLPVPGAPDEEQPPWIQYCLRKEAERWAILVAGEDGAPTGCGKRCTPHCRSAGIFPWGSRKLPRHEPPRLTVGKAARRRGQMLLSTLAEAQQQCRVLHPGATGAELASHSRGQLLAEVQGLLAEAKSHQYEVQRGRPPPLPGKGQASSTPPLPNHPSLTASPARYDEGTEEGLRGYVVFDLFGGLGPGAMTFVRCGIRVRRYYYVDPTPEGLETALRGVALLTKDEPWLFPQETMEQARRDQLGYVEEATEAWAGLPRRG